MKKALFIASGIVLLLVFMAATLYYKAEKGEQAGQLAQSNASSLSREHAPSKGDPAARVSIVEFLDPACETCRRFYPFVKDLMAANPGKIRLALRYTPFHENSEQAVALLIAADRQGKHWQALEVLLENQDDWVAHHVVQPDRIWRHIEGLGLDMDRLRADIAAPETARRIALDMDDARALEVTKTPSFFVNGKPLAQFGYEELKTLVDEAVADAYR